MDVKGEILRKSENEVEWKVQNFLYLPGEEEYMFESPKFECLLRTWSFQCWPNGNCLYPSGIRINLTRKSSVSKNTFVCRIGIKKISGLEYISRTSDTLGDDWGVSLILNRDMLKTFKSTLAPKGEVTFFCIFEAEPSGEEAAQATHPAGTDKLSQSFKNLLLSGEHHDTVIKVKDQEFRAHKLILVVRSEVFASMFRHDTIERETNVITIEDCDPEAFRELLTFFYSAKLENVSVENVIDLYNIADKYQVEEVKSECVKFMARNMTVDNFCDFITLALTRSERVLLERATEYFTQNAKKIAVTVKWLSFHKMYPTESNELHIKALMHLDPDLSI